MFPLYTKYYLEEITYKVKKLISSAIALSGYVINDIDKRPRSFKIGVFSIFLVVTFLVVLQSALSLLPIVFLRLAQNQSGEVDFIMTPIAASNDTRLSSSDNTTLFRGLNLTDIDMKLQGLSDIAATSARWVLPVGLSNTKTPDNLFQAVGLLLDSKRERDLGIGMNIKLKDLGPKQCWISDSIKSLTGITGNSIHLHLDLLEALATAQAVSASGTTPNSADDIAMQISKQFIVEWLTAEGAVQDVSDPNIYWFGNSSTPTPITLGRLLASTTTNPSSSNTKSSSTSPYAGKNITTPYGNFTIPQNFTQTQNVTVGSTLLLLNYTSLNISKFNTTNNTAFINSVRDASLRVNATKLAVALAPNIRKGFTLDYDFEIVEKVDSPEGKWPIALGNIFAFDSQHIVPLLTESMANALQNITIQSQDEFTNTVLTTYLSDRSMVDQIQRYNNDIKLDEYALSVYIKLTDRGSVYSSQNAYKPNLVKASNNIYSKLGRDHPSAISAALADALETFFTFKNLLDNIFDATVFILVLLSALLIYSLMNSNVEEKVYEFGMLRALGLQKLSLSILLLLQSSFFAIPGLILGLLISFSINFLVTYFITNYVSIPKGVAPAVSAILLGVGMATIVSNKVGHQEINGEGY